MAACWPSKPVAPARAPRLLRSTAAKAPERHLARSLRRARVGAHPGATAAGRYYGVDQYWTPAIDYGFSKTREEALDKWDHDRLLADVVRVIRMTPSFGSYVGIRGRPHRRPRPAPGRRPTGAGGLCRRRRSQSLPGAESAKASARGRRSRFTRTCLFFPPTPQGMSRLRHRQSTCPCAFSITSHKTWSNETPAGNLEIAEGDYFPASGLTYLQIGREAWASRKARTMASPFPRPRPSPPPTTVTIARARRRA